MFDFILKKTRLKHLFGSQPSQSGQGTLEYILLLVIVVIVIFGLLYQFNDAFRKWSANYFGNYIACLLEYGELPSLGGGSTLQGCDAEFEAFSLASGRKPKASEEADKNSNKDKDNGSQSANAESSNSGQGSLNFGDRTRNLAGRGRRGARAGSGGGSRFGYRDSDGFDESEDDLFGSGRAKVTSENKNSNLRPRHIYMPYMAEYEERKASETKATVAKGDENPNLRPPRLIVNKRTIRKPTSMEDKGFNLGFGGFIRFLFITAIIIAIIILLGSQALQISKEWD